MSSPDSTSAYSLHSVSWRDSSEFSRPLTSPAPSRPSLRPLARSRPSDTEAEAGAGHPDNEFRELNDIDEIKRYEDFWTVDWVEDAVRANHLKLKQQETHGGSTIRSRALRLYLNAKSWLLLILMGVIIGTIAAGINVATEWLSDLRTGRCSAGFYLNKAFCCGVETETASGCSAWVPWSAFAVGRYAAFCAVSLAFGLTAALLVKFYAPYAAGSGISEIKCIIAGFTMRGFLGAGTLAIKSLALPLAIGSGLSVGKEGPSVHYAVCVGNVVARAVREYRRSATQLRQFLSATAAAGVAVAFGSPMGGVLFSIEEISSVFQLSTMWRSYFCALVATVTLAAWNPFRTGQIVLFQVQYDREWHFFEVPFYMVLGVFGGVYGCVVIKYNLRVAAFRKRYLQKYAVEEVVVLVALTALVCYFNEFLALDMTKGMEILFHECENGWEHADVCQRSHYGRIAMSLIIATAVRMVLIVLSYGSKVPAGIFVPSMAVGATFGRLVGILVDKVYQSHQDSSFFATCKPDTPCITPGTYAFLGAAAGLSGMTHLTVTVVVIMYELTGALRYIIPLMIVVGTTKAVNDRWGHGGIADQMIYFNGLPFIDSKEEHVFDAPAAQGMTTEVVAFTSGLMYSQVKAVLAETDFHCFPIVESEEQPFLVGFIGRAELQLAVQNVLTKRQIADTAKIVFSRLDMPRENTTESSEESLVYVGGYVNYSPISVAPQVPLETVLDILHRLGPQIVFVTEFGRLVGLITRKDILKYHFKITRHSSTARDKYEEQNTDQRIWESIVAVFSLLARFKASVMARFRPVTLPGGSGD